MAGDEKNLLAEGSSKEACERIRSFSTLPIVKVIFFQTSKTICCANDGKSINDDDDG